MKVFFWQINALFLSASQNESLHNDFRANLCQRIEFNFFQK